MTRWGEVSYRVKRAIAFHERFTVAQLADSTGLTYEQVEQVVHRLVNRGDVRQLLPEELNEAEQEVEKRVGRPRARYTLTDDPVRRAEFLADMEAIAAAARLELASARRPDTPYYAAALQAIEAVESGEEQDRFSRLKEAEELLTYGREYEALVPEGLEVVQAYYDEALAWVKSLRRDFAAAERFLERAEEAFVRADLEEESRRARDRRWAVQMEQSLNEIEDLLGRGDNPLPVLKQLRELLLQVENPLHIPFRRAVELLTKTLRPGTQPRVYVVETPGLTRREIRKLMDAVNRLDQQARPIRPIPEPDLTPSGEKRGTWQTLAKDSADRERLH
jgi:hypothetical protein